MRFDRTGAQATGWCYGPWNTDLRISVGYSNGGVDQPHRHTQITEIYFVARGWASVRVGAETLKIGEGDVLTVEPGEGHTFLDSSPDYFHFVVQTPGFEGAAAQAEKIEMTHAD